jgi:protein-S-isoprenylcysteine O-methyltransferase Ste14
MNERPRLYFNIQHSTFNIEHSTFLVSVGTREKAEEALTMWILRHAFAIAVLPVTAAVVVPLLLCRRYGITFRPPSTTAAWACAILAVILFLIGALLFVKTVVLFASRGRGTLAPWDPPARFVAAGPYRFVRNPMISGVFLIITAEAALPASPVLLAWAAIFLIVNLIYIPLFEEPQLERRFGEAYRAYKRNVPRFLPRLHPWSG